MSCPNISLAVIEADTPGKRAFGLFIYLSMVITAPLCLAIFLWGKTVAKFERVRSRNTTLVMSAFLGVMIQAHGDPLEMMISPQSYPCVAQLIISILIVPFIGASIVGKLVSFFFRSRFEQQAIAKRNEQNASEEGENVGDYEKQQRLGAMTQGARELFLFKNGSVLNLESLRFLQSGYANALLLVIVFLIPAIIVSAITAVADPLMASGCTACFVNFTIGSFLVFQASITSTLVFLALIRVRNLPDTWGIIPETLVCTVFATLAVVGYGLTFFLPNVYPVWSFDFLLSIGLVGIFVTQTLLQVAVAWRKERFSTRATTKRIINVGSNRSPSVALDKPHLQQVLAEPELAKRFEEHLGHEFGVESLFFYRDAQRWAKEYNDVSTNTRKARAKHIVNVYIRSNSVFAVNLPSNVSRELIAAVEQQKEPGPDFFADAIHEIHELLERGALSRFMARERKNGTVTVSVSA